MLPTAPSVLILDDDPEHLKIYGWLVEQAGFAPVPCLVKRSGPELPGHLAVDLVLLDYVLNCNSATRDIALLLRQRCPGVPVVLLSDIPFVPPEMESAITRFVRKGQPAKLTAVLKELLREPESVPH